MALIEPLNEEELAALREPLEIVRQAMGFLPNSLLTMARRPELLRSFVGLARAVQGGSLDPRIGALVAHAASSVAGCAYCQAHTADTARRRGLADEAVLAACSGVDLGQLEPAEAAAVQFARAAAAVPNAVGPEQQRQLKVHFTDDEVLDVVAVVSLFGFLNRWNDTMATLLEREPLATGGDLLTATGWSPGKHAGSS